MNLRSLGFLSIMEVFFVSAFAQELNPSVLNILRYGNGRLGTGELTTNFEFIENLTDVRIGFPYEFTVGVRLLYDQPPEVGPRFKGIRRRWVEFQKEGVMLRAGNSSQLFGRGLALNLFEDRGLAYDTWLDGIRASWETPRFRATIVAGAVEFWDSIVVARTENYDIRGANVEGRPWDWLTLGASYLSAEGAIPQPQIAQPIHAEIPEVYATIQHEEFDVFLGWSRKWTDVPAQAQSSAGTGVYGSASYAGTGFGIAIDYKNYQFDIRDPFTRFDATRPTKMLPFQNPPIVQREHSSTFLTRALHQVDFNDEVGVQVNVFFTPAKNTTLTMNASLSSDHEEFSYRLSSFDFARIKRRSGFLPSTSHALSPYWELFFEGEHTFDNGQIVRLGIAQRQFVQAVRFSANVNDHITKSTVVPVNFLTLLGETTSLQLQVEQEWVHDNYNAAKMKFSNTLLAATVAWTPDITVSGRIEFTSNPFDLSGRKTWFAGELGYRIGGSHTMTFTFGQERGGQVCMNGVCRFVQPFTGVRFFVQSII